jgi:DNA recombination protein RmuC
MEVIAVVIGLLVGLCLGATGAVLMTRTRNAQDGAELAAVNVRLEERSKQFAHLEEEFALQKQELERSQGEASLLQQDKARLEAEIEGERRSNSEKLELLDQAEQKLREAFQALSAEALDKNNQSFLRLARTSLQEYQTTAVNELEKRQGAFDGLVKPIRESLEKVEAKLHEVEKERVESNATLFEPRQSSPISHDPRPLGRNPAQARGRDGRNA